jgi:methylglutaconyl-CoA hydratase
MSIRSEQQGEVLVVTLARPEARNAFDLAMIQALRKLFTGLDARPAAGADSAGSGGPGPPPHASGTSDPPRAGVPVRPHAILLQSEGPVFCAGADLGDMKRLGQASFQENQEAALRMGEMFRAVRSCPAPVVARVQGPAYGGGVGLVCACDIVVASQEARFAFSEIRLGLVAGVIAPLVMDRIGQAAARHYFLTGDPIRAVDGLRIGLIDRLVPPDGLDREIGRTIGSLLRGGPAALGRTKALLEGTLERGFAGSLEFTARMIAEARTSGEAQAALAAFFRKEAAPWARDASWPPGGAEPADKP